MKKLIRLHEKAAEIREKNRHLLKTTRLLSLFLVIVAGFDVVSTNAALAAGHIEGNPFVVEMQQYFGSWWSVPKIGLHLLLGLLVLWLPTRRMVSMSRLVIVGYLAIVTNNFYFAGWLT